MSDIKINEIEVTKLNLQPGDTLAVTIKSDDLDEHILNHLKAQFKIAFPDNRVLLFGLGSKDDIKFTAISEATPQVASYCVDCDCGKKEGCGA